MPHAALRALLAPLGSGACVRLRAPLLYRAPRGRGARAPLGEETRVISLTSRVESLSHSAGREKHTLDSIERPRRLSNVHFKKTPQCPKKEAHCALTLT